MMTGMLRITLHIGSYTQPDEQKVLKEAVLKKCQPGTVLDEKGMRRLQGFLLRRGFGYSDISHVLEEMQIRMEVGEKSEF